MVKVQSLLYVTALFYCSYGIRLISWDRTRNISGLSTEQIDGFDQNRGICVRDGVRQCELAKRGETAEIEASVNGATVVVVAAAGVWSIVTIGSCGTCVWTAGANLPGCVMCAGGMLVSFAATTIIPIS